MDSELPLISARFLAGRERLFAYALALVRTRAVAEDIFQDTYVALTRAIERGEVIADLPAWCRGVARNLALRHWQERERVQRLPATELLDAIDRTFAEEDDVDDEALMRALATCRSGLGASALALLDLKYVRDLPMRAIAEETRRSERAVITALARIRRNLMDCIATRIGGVPHV
ncbi:MAG TPA: sigma-70 family RNA polymerase sigma factor [Planctomycetota bacterium]|nr:sigma-70 family RNA polymerase sigma factor [Planctomycetota bacterium]